MNKFFQKASSGLLMLSTTLTLTGVGMISTVQAVGLPAKQLTEVTAQLSDVQSKTSSNHTISFKVKSTDTIKAIKIQYVIKPSGTTTSPDNLTTSSANLPGGSNDEITVDSSASAGWAKGLGTNGTVLLTSSTGATPAGEESPVSIALSSITNNDATVSGGNECDAIANSETCYIRVTTYASDATQDDTTILDSGVASYTVIAPTTVTATVDPSLTLTIAGVTTVATINSNDTNAACSTGGDVAATSTAIPFGNIQVGVAKCGQQALTVATNAQNGYKVYQKFLGTDSAADMMKGVNTSNNFDPFSGSGATWAAPKAFSTPSGTANTDSGWVGVRVKTATSPGLSQFATSNYYAPPAVTSGVGNKVMDNSGPDNGSTPTYVTYKIMAGASQPADTYSGTSVYNVVASY